MSARRRLLPLLLAALSLLCGCTQDVSGVLPGVYLPDGEDQIPAPTGQKAAASYRAAADALRELGFSDVDGEAAQALIADVEAQDAVEWMPEDTGGCALTLLCEIGWGDYDYESGAWTAASSQVYAFDVEVFDPASAYTMFLEGVEALVGDGTFTDVTEDTSGVDEDAGAGIQTVSFTCGGKRYTYGAQVNGDWFDTGFIDCVGAALRKEGGARRLLTADDGYQMVFLFYNTEEWAGKFTAALGIPLTRAGDLPGEALLPSGVFSDSETK